MTERRQFTDAGRVLTAFSSPAACLAFLCLAGTIAYSPQAPAQDSSTPPVGAFSLGAQWSGIQALSDGVLTLEEGSSATIEVSLPDLSVGQEVRITVLSQSTEVSLQCVDGVDGVDGCAVTMGGQQASWIQTSTDAPAVKAVANADDETIEDTDDVTLQVDAFDTASTHRAKPKKLRCRIPRHGYRATYLRLLNKPIFLGIDPEFEAGLNAPAPSTAEIVITVQPVDYFKLSRADDDREFPHRTVGTIIVPAGQNTGRVTLRLKDRRTGVWFFAYFRCRAQPLHCADRFHDGVGKLLTPEGTEEVPDPDSIPLSVRRHWRYGHEKFRVHESPELEATWTALPDTLPGPPSVRQEGEQAKLEVRLRNRRRFLRRIYDPEDMADMYMRLIPEDASELIPVHPTICDQIRSTGHDDDDDDDDDDEGDDDDNEGDDGDNEGDDDEVCNRTFRVKLDNDPEPRTEHDVHIQLWLASTDPDALAGTWRTSITVPRNGYELTALTLSARESWADIGVTATVTLNEPAPSTATVELQATSPDLQRVKFPVIIPRNSAQGSAALTGLGEGAWQVQALNVAFASSESGDQLKPDLRSQMQDMELERAQLELSLSGENLEQGTLREGDTATLTVSIRNFFSHLGQPVQVRLEMPEHSEDLSVSATEVTLTAMAPSADVTVTALSDAVAPEPRERALIRARAPALSGVSAQTRLFIPRHGYAFRTLDIPQTGRTNEHFTVEGRLNGPVPDGVDFLVTLDLEPSDGGEPLQKSSWLPSGYEIMFSPGYFLSPGLYTLGSAENSFSFVHPSSENLSFEPLDQRRVEGAPIGRRIEISEPLELQLSLSGENLVRSTEQSTLQEGDTATLTVSMRNLFSDWAQEQTAQVRLEVSEHSEDLSFAPASGQGMGVQVITFTLTAAAPSMDVTVTATSDTVIPEPREEAVIAVNVSLPEHPGLTTETRVFIPRHGYALRTLRIPRTVRTNEDFVVEVALNGPVPDGMSFFVGLDFLGGRANDVDIRLRSGETMAVLRFFQSNDRQPAGLYAVEYVETSFAFVFPGDNVRRLVCEPLDQCRVERRPAVERVEIRRPLELQLSLSGENLEQQTLREGDTATLTVSLRNLFSIQEQTERVRLRLEILEHSEDLSFVSASGEDADILVTTVTLTTTTPSVDVTVTATSDAAVPEPREEVVITASANLTDHPDLTAEMRMFIPRHGYALKEAQAPPDGRAGEEVLVEMELNGPEPDGIRFIVFLDLARVQLFEEDASGGEGFVRHLETGTVTGPLNLRLGHSTTLPFAMPAGETGLNLAFRLPAGLYRLSNFRSSISPAEPLDQTMMQGGLNREIAIRGPAELDVVLSGENLEQTTLREGDAAILTVSARNLLFSQEQTAQVRLEISEHSEDLSFAPASGEGMGVLVTTFTLTAAAPSTEVIVTAISDGIEPEPREEAVIAVNVNLSDHPGFATETLVFIPRHGYAFELRAPPDGRVGEEFPVDIELNGPTPDGTTFLGKLFLDRVPPLGEDALEDGGFVLLPAERKDFPDGSDWERDLLAFTRRSGTTTSRLSFWLPTGIYRLTSFTVFFQSISGPLDQVNLSGGSDHEFAIRGPAELRLSLDGEKLRQGTLREGNTATLTVSAANLLLSQEQALQVRLEILEHSEDLNFALASGEGMGVSVTTVTLTVTTPSAEVTVTAVSDAVIPEPREAALIAATAPSLPEAATQSLFIPRHGYAFRTLRIPQTGRTNEDFVVEVELNGPVPDGAALLVTLDLEPSAGGASLQRSDWLNSGSEIASGFSGLPAGLYTLGSVENSFSFVEPGSVVPTFKPLDQRRVEGAPVGQRIELRGPLELQLSLSGENLKQRTLREGNTATLTVSLRNLFSDWVQEQTERVRLEVSEHSEDLSLVSASGEGASVQAATVTLTAAAPSSTAEILAVDDELTEPRETVLFMATVAGRPDIAPTTTQMQVGYSDYAVNLFPFPANQFPPVSPPYPQTLEVQPGERFFIWVVMHMNKAAPSTWNATVRARLRGSAEMRIFSYIVGPGRVFRIFEDLNQERPGLWDLSLEPLRFSEGERSVEGADDLNINALQSTAVLHILPQAVSLQFEPSEIEAHQAFTLKAGLNAPAPRTATVDVRLRLTSDPAGTSRLAEAAIPAGDSEVSVAFPDGILPPGTWEAFVEGGEWEGGPPLTVDAETASAQLTVQVNLRLQLELERKELKEGDATTLRVSIEGNLLPEWRIPVSLLVGPFRHRGDAALSLQRVEFTASESSTLVRVTAVDDDGPEARETALIEANSSGALPPGVSVASAESALLIGYSDYAVNRFLLQAFPSGELVTQLELQPGERFVMRAELDETPAPALLNLTVHGRLRGSAEMRSFLLTALPLGDGIVRSGIIEEERSGYWDLALESTPRFSAGAESVEGVDDLTLDVEMSAATAVLLVLPRAASLQFEPASAATHQAFTLSAGLNAAAPRTATLAVELHLTSDRLGTSRTVEVVIPAGASEGEHRIADGVLSAGVWEASVNRADLADGPQLQVDAAARGAQLTVRERQLNLLPARAALPERDGGMTTLRVSVAGPALTQPLAVVLEVLSPHETDLTFVENSRSAAAAVILAAGTTSTEVPVWVHDDAEPEPRETAIIEGRSEDAITTTAQLLIGYNDYAVTGFGPPAVLSELTVRQPIPVQVSLNGPAPADLQLIVTAQLQSPEPAPPMRLPGVEGTLTVPQNSSRSVFSLPDGLLNAGSWELWLEPAPGFLSGDPLVDDTVPETAGTTWALYVTPRVDELRFEPQAAETGQDFRIEADLNTETPQTATVTVRLQLTANPSGTVRTLEVTILPGERAGSSTVTGGVSLAGAWRAEATAARLEDGRSMPIREEGARAELAVQGPVVLQLTPERAQLKEGDATTLRISASGALAGQALQVRLAAEGEHAEDLSFAEDAQMQTMMTSLVIGGPLVEVRVWARDDEQAEPRETAAVRASLLGTPPAGVSDVTPAQTALLIGWNDYAVTGLTLERAGTEISRSTQGRVFDVRLRFNAPTPSTLNLGLRAILPGPGISELSLPQNVEIPANTLERLAPWAGGLPLAGDWTAAAVGTPPPVFSGAIPGVDDPAAVTASARNLEIIPDYGAPPEPYLDVGATGADILIVEEGERPGLFVHAVGVPQDRLPTEMKLTLFDTDNDGALDVIFGTTGSSTMQSFPVEFAETRWSVSISARDDGIPEPPEEAVAVLTMPGAPSVAVRMLIKDNDGYVPPADGPFGVIIEATKEAISEEALRAGSHRTMVSVGVEGLEAGETLDVELTSADRYDAGDGDGEPDLLFEGDDGALAPTLMVAVTGGAGPVTVWAQARDDDIVENREQVLVWGKATSATAEPDTVLIGWNDYDVSALTLTNAGGNRITEVDLGEPFMVKLEFNARLPAQLDNIGMRMALRGPGPESGSAYRLALRASNGELSISFEWPWPAGPLASGVWDVTITPPPPQFSRPSVMEFVDESTATVTALPQVLIVRGLRVAVEAQDEALAESARTGNNATTLHVSVVNTLLSEDLQVRVRLAVDPEHAGDLSFADGAMMSTRELIITANAEPVPVRVWALDDDLLELREIVTVEATGEVIGEAAGTAVAPGGDTLLIGWNDYRVSALTLSATGEIITEAQQEQPFTVKVELNGAAPSTLNAMVRVQLRGGAGEETLSFTVEPGGSSASLLIEAGLSQPGTWDVLIEPTPGFSAGAGSAEGIDELDVFMTEAATLLILPEAISLQFEPASAETYRPFTLSAGLDGAAPRTATLNIRLRLTSDPQGTSQTVEIVIPADALEDGRTLANGVSSAGTWEAFVEAAEWEGGPQLAVNQGTARDELTVQERILSLQLTQERAALKEGGSTTLQISATGSPAGQTLQVRLAAEGEHAEDLSFAEDAQTSATVISLAIGGPPVEVQAWARDDDLTEPRETVTVEASVSGSLPSGVSDVTSAETRLLIGYSDYKVSALTLLAAGEMIAEAQQEQPFTVEVELNGAAPSTLNAMVRAQLREGAGEETLSFVVERGGSSASLPVTGGLSQPGVWDVSIAPTPRFSEGEKSAEGVDELDAPVTAEAAVLLILPEAASLQLDLLEMEAYQALTLSVRLDGAAPRPVTLNVRLRLVSDPLGTSQTVEIVIPAGALEGSATLANGLSPAGVWEAFAEGGGWEGGPPLILSAELADVRMTVQKTKLILNLRLERTEMGEGDTTVLHVSIAGNMPSAQSIPVDLAVMPPHEMDAVLSSQRVELTKAQRSASVQLRIQDDALIETQEAVMIQASVPETLPLSVSTVTSVMTQLQVGYDPSDSVDAFFVITADGSAVALEMREGQTEALRVSLSSPVQAGTTVSLMLSVRRPGGMQPVFGPQELIIPAGEMHAQSAPFALQQGDYEALASTVRLSVASLSERLALDDSSASLKVQPLLETRVLIGEEPPNSGQSVMSLQEGQSATLHVSVRNSYASDGAGGRRNWRLTLSTEEWGADAELSEGGDAFSLLVQQPDQLDSLDLRVIATEDGLAEDTEEIGVRMKALHTTDQEAFAAYSTARVLIYRHGYRVSALSVSLPQTEFSMTVTATVSLNAPAPAGSEVKVPVRARLQGETGEFVNTATVRAGERTATAVFTLDASGLWEFRATTGIFTSWSAGEQREAESQAPMRTAQLQEPPPLVLHLEAQNLNQPGGWLAEGSTASWTLSAEALEYYLSGAQTLAVTVEVVELGSDGPGDARLVSPAQVVLSLAASTSTVRVELVADGAAEIGETIELRVSAAGASSAQAQAYIPRNEYRIVSARLSAERVYGEEEAYLIVKLNTAAPADSAVGVQYLGRGLTGENYYGFVADARIPASTDTVVRRLYSYGILERGRHQVQVGGGYFIDGGDLRQGNGDQFQVPADALAQAQLVYELLAGTPSLEWELTGGLLVGAGRYSSGYRMLLEGEALQLRMRADSLRAEAPLRVELELVQPQGDREDLRATTETFLLTLESALGAAELEALVDGEVEPRERVAVRLRGTAGESGSAHYWEFAEEEAVYIARHGYEAELTLEPVELLLGESAMLRARLNAPAPALSGGWVRTTPAVRSQWDGMFWVGFAEGESEVEQSFTPEQSGAYRFAGPGFLTGNRGNDQGTFALESAQGLRVWDAQEMLSLELSRAYMAEGETVTLTVAMGSLLGEERVTVALGDGGREDVVIAPAEVVLSASMLSAEAEVGLREDGRPESREYLKLSGVAQARGATFRDETAVISARHGYEAELELELSYPQEGAPARLQAEINLNAAADGPGSNSWVLLQLWRPGAARGELAPVYLASGARSGTTEWEASSAGRYRVTTVFASFGAGFGATAGGRRYRDQLELPVRPSSALRYVSGWETPEAGDGSPGAAPAPDASWAASPRSAVTVEGGRVRLELRLLEGSVPADREAIGVEALVAPEHAGDLRASPARLELSAENGWGGVMEVRAVHDGEAEDEETVQLRLQGTDGGAQTATIVILRNGYAVEALEAETSMAWPADEFVLKARLNAPAPAGSTVEVTVKAFADRAERASAERRLAIAPGARSATEVMTLREVGFYTLTVSSATFAAGVGRGQRELELEAMDIGRRTLALPDYNYRAGDGLSTSKQLRILNLYFVLFAELQVESSAERCTERMRISGSPLRRFHCMDVTDDGFTDSTDTLLLQRYINGVRGGAAPGASELLQGTDLAGGTEEETAERAAQVARRIWGLHPRTPTFCAAFGIDCD